MFTNLCPVQVHNLSWQLGAMAAAGATSARPASARGWRPTRSVGRAAPRSRGREARPSAHEDCGCCYDIRKRGTPVYSGMKASVLCGVVCPREDLAACVGAMRLLSRMHPHVCSEEAGRRQGHTACVAAIRLLPCMRPHAWAVWQCAGHASGSLRREVSGSQVRRSNTRTSTFYRGNLPLLPRFGKLQPIRAHA